MVSAQCQEAGIKLELEDIGDYPAFLSAYYAHSGASFSRAGANQGANEVDWLYKGHGVNGSSNASQPKEFADAELQRLISAATQEFNKEARVKLAQDAQRRIGQLAVAVPTPAGPIHINADDFGMCHAANAAITRSLTDGVVRSTTLMVPCAWALHAMQWLAAHPDIPFGVHLTAVGDSLHYRWKPISCRDHVSSLVDETGHFYNWEGAAFALALRGLLYSDLMSRSLLDDAFARIANVRRSRARTSPHVFSRTYD